MMIKKSLRKEVVCCDKCKRPRTFWYLSDFAYGQRLIYFDNDIDLAYIDLLDDVAYSEYVDVVKEVLSEHNSPCELDSINDFINKTFGITCDTIYGKRVDFMVGQKRCLECGSTVFERNMMESEGIVATELPIVSHEEWNLLDCVHKKCIIHNEMKKEGMI